MDTLELRHWLTLAHLPGLPGAVFRRLVISFPDPVELLEAGDRHWRDAGAPRDARCARRDWVTSGMSHPVRRAVETALKTLEREAAGIVVLGHDDYPALLSQIHDPPPLLYVAGDRSVLRQAQFALVGSRRCSTASARAAMEFAAGLVNEGFSVCSGMALGIDGAAHRGAIEVGGPTLAVLGTGIDVCYPQRHAALRREICENGALVSEFNPGTPPRREQFPKRNRLISGLSVGVLVAEASLRSGSLITARLALEQGREVFALPHSIYDPGGRGCHALLRDGARLAETPADLLEDTVQLSAAHRELQQPGKKDPLPALGTDPVAVDELVAAGVGSADEVLVALQRLELEGLLEQRGGLYSRKLC